MSKREKTGGRQKGTPNKLTREIRATLKGFIEQEIENLPEMLKNLPEEKRLDVLIKLLPYVLPKTQAVEYSMGEPLASNWDTL